MDGQTAISTEGRTPRDGLATASLVLGVIALSWDLFGFLILVLLWSELMETSSGIGIVLIFARLALALSAVVTGILARRRPLSENDRAHALAGVWLGGVVAAFSLFPLAIGIFSN